MIDFKKIGEFFTARKLWEKPFNQWTREEMEVLAEVFFSSPGETVPRDGWKLPYIKDGHFIIPSNSHPSFHWWKPGGKSIIETLTEIGAPAEMIEAARPIGWDPNAIRH